MNIEYNGLTIGEGTNFTVNKLQGFYDVPIRTARDDLTDQHGGVVWKQKYGARFLSIEGWIRASSASEYFENIASISEAFEIENEAKKLTFEKWDGDSKDIYARVLHMPQIVEVGGQPTSAQYRVEMVADNPFWQGQTDVGGSTGLVVTTGAPLSSPLPAMIGSRSGGQVVISNTGVAGYAKFTFTGGVDRPTVTSLVAGKHFTIDLTTNVSDSLVVEWKNGGVAVSLNGTRNDSAFGGDFFEILPGGNTLVFDAMTYDANSLMTVKYYIQTLTP